MDDRAPGSGGAPGLLSRLGSGLSRLFGSPRGGRGGAAVLSLAECASELAGRAEELFSVFPPAREALEDGEAPNHAFCVHVARAFEFRVRAPEGPVVVGLLGAGGCGKSSLFNHLSGAAASRVDILPHTTRGPVAATGDRVPLTGLMAPLGLEPVKDDARSRGALDRVLVHRSPDFPFPGLVLVDLPDLNTQTAREEGTLTACLLPWLDAGLLVYSLESFDRVVMDRTLEFLGPLRTRLLVVFNRKDGRGPLAEADLADLKGRAADLEAAGPFVFPDLRDPAPARDDRGLLRTTLDDLAEPGARTRRTEGLRATLVHLGRLALERHARQAGRAEDTRKRFVAELGDLRRRLELDPMAAVSSDGREMGLLLHDLQGLIGNPMELLRRWRRGQSVGEAFQNTFSIQARIGELEAAAEKLRGAEASAYVERLRRHFGNVASGLVHAYARLVGEDEDLFVERACRHDLPGRVFDDREAVIVHGFETFRDETVRYLSGLRERIESTGGLETALTGLAYFALAADMFFFTPGVASVGVLGGGGWILVQVLGSDFQPVLRRHREFRRKQREGLDRATGLLAAGLEDHFLAEGCHFGRLKILAREDRERLGVLLGRLEQPALEAEEGARG